MSEGQTGDPEDLISAEEASTLLEVPVEQVHTMVEEGMLNPSGSTDDPQFLRAEVLAVRQVGG